ncbi:hypothetical protein QQS21_002667 [Conoideocrella luteorostrata]|uniref:Uncharacterized protein n=1 Tax=Conoideocrella luteorostrata TaxID=1105319 RepID=A0AAJ0G129_9HYPO|nr:hypothetical protein QQS21_002667 [Conoideocrella luteorostrata]
MEDGFFTWPHVAARQQPNEQLQQLKLDSTQCTNNRFQDHLLTEFIDTGPSDYYIFDGNNVPQFGPFHEHLGGFGNNTVTTDNWAYDPTALDGETTLIDPQLSHADDVDPGDTAAISNTTVHDHPKEDVNEYCTAFFAPMKDSPNGRQRPKHIDHLDDQSPDASLDINHDADINIEPSVYPFGTPDFSSAVGFGTYKDAAPSQAAYDTACGIPIPFTQQFREIPGNDIFYQYLNYHPYDGPPVSSADLCPQEMNDLPYDVSSADMYLQGSADQARHVAPNPHWASHPHLENLHLPRAYNFGQGLQSLQVVNADGVSPDCIRRGEYTFNRNGEKTPHNPDHKKDGTRREKVRHPKKGSRKRGLRDSDESIMAQSWYDPWVYTPPSWRVEQEGDTTDDEEESLTPCGEFKYGADAQLMKPVYSKRDIQDYIKHCFAKTGRPLTLWVQGPPTTCAHRQTDHDKNCIYGECPLAHRTVVPASPRVAFDEFPAQTSNGIKDPHKVAGVMHLYCLEQCVDIVDLYERKVLFPDTRTFPSEEKNPFVLDPFCRYDAVRDLWDVWFDEQKYVRARAGMHRNRGEVGVPWKPRAAEDSLFRALVLGLKEKQGHSKQKVRDVRNGWLNGATWAGRTIDIHLGDLSVLAENQKHHDTAIRIRRARAAAHRKELREKKARMAGKGVGVYINDSRTKKRRTTTEAETEQRDKDASALNNRDFMNQFEQPKCSCPAMTMRSTNKGRASISTAPTSTAGNGSIPTAWMSLENPETIRESVPERRAPRKRKRL